MNLEEELGPILWDIEDVLWHSQLNKGDTKPNYSRETFRAVFKIFTSVLFDYMDNLRRKEGIDDEDFSNMIDNASAELRSIIRKYTGLNTKELYKKDE